MGVYRRFCIHGHDTFIVGRTPNHHCKQCNRVRNREWEETESGKIARGRSRARRAQRRLIESISKKESLIEELEGLLNG